MIVVDEHRIFSEALGKVIDIEEDLDFVGVATTIEDAVVLVTDEAPDVVVIDADLGRDAGSSSDGLRATELVKDAMPDTRVLLLAADMDLDTMVRAASLGASGFLPKSSHIETICDAIRTAKDGGMFVEREFLPVLVRRLQQTSRRPMRGGSTKPALTARELEVLELLGEGLDVRSISGRLGISINTGRRHVRNLLVKLGSHSQLEAVVEAVHHGLLPRLS